MMHLTRDEYASALRLVARVQAQADNFDRFAQVLVQSLNDFVTADMTLLSVCDRVTGQRQVVGWPAVPPGGDAMECLDRGGSSPRGFAAMDWRGRS